MRLGKIDYLNLLPFDVFIKKSSLPSQFKAMIAYKKSYPAKLNADFLFGRIDMGFLSSIMAYGRACKTYKAGIISKGEVWSVLALPRKEKKDYQSASSNALIQVLGIKGEVLIGDKALCYKLSGGECLDLGKIWWERENLPFIFGLFCANSSKEIAKRLTRSFASSSIKIPHYILMQASKKSGIKPQDILLYLKKITYKIGKKEQKGLENFYRELLFLGIKKPKRF